MVLFAWFSGEDVSIFYPQAPGVLWFICWIHLIFIIQLIQHFLYNHVVINFLHFCWSILCVFSLFQTETSQILFGGATWIPALADDALELSGDGQLQLGLWYLGGFSNKNPRKRKQKSEKLRNAKENWLWKPWSNFENEDRPQGGGSSSSRPTPGPSSPRRSRSTRRTERPEKEGDPTDALHRKIALMFATVVTGSYDASATVTAFGLRQTLLHW